eukprot:EG_transcript_50363
MAPKPQEGKEDKEKAKKVDEEVVMEFGGPIGCTCIMVLSPILMYYFWVCLEYYGGALQYPGSLGTPEGLAAYASRMAGHVAAGAYPTLRAFNIYTVFMLFQIVIAILLPGPVIEGLPIPSENFRKL